MRIYTRTYLKEKVPTLNTVTCGESAVNTMNRVLDMLNANQMPDGLLAYQLGLIGGSHKSSYICDLAMSLAAWIRYEQEK